MATFNFDTSVLTATFKGLEFYEYHKNDVFLSQVDAVENILCQGKKMRAQLKTVQPGGILTIGTLLVDGRTPLTIKRGGPNAPIGDLDYTLNRLTGMCAAYAAKQTAAYIPRSAMAVSLGLDVTRDRLLYYSATPGSEHFPEIFSYRPLLCAIKQLSLGKVSKENISRIAAVKSSDGNTLTSLLCENKTAAKVDLDKFSSGGGRGMVQLDLAIRSLKALVPELKI